MSDVQLKKTLEKTIQAFTSGNLTENSILLFKTLGYVTDRQAPLDKPNYAVFKETYIADKKFDESRAKTDEWLYIDLLFQLSKDEVLKQTSLFDTKKLDNTIIETYLFFGFIVIMRTYRYICKKNLISNEYKFA